jgi:hypothetical protein
MRELVRGHGGHIFRRARCEREQTFEARTREHHALVAPSGVTAELPLAFEKDDARSPARTPRPRPSRREERGARVFQGLRHRESARLDDIRSYDKVGSDDLDPALRREARRAPAGGAATGGERHCSGDDGEPPEPSGHTPTSMSQRATPHRGTRAVCGSGHGSSTRQLTWWDQPRRSGRHCAGKFGRVSVGQRLTPADT